MNKEQKALKEKLMDLGLPLTTAKRYACGEWAIPDSIKKLIKENETKKE